MVTYGRMQYDDDNFTKPILSHLYSKGISVLHCAIANGHYDVVQALLAAHANLNHMGKSNKKTALFLASELGDLDMVKLLLKHGAKVNIQDHYGTESTDR